MTQQDDFDRWLMRQAAQCEPLADDGFTDKVMAALPARRTERPLWRRFRILLPALACLAYMLLLIPGDVPLHLTDLLLSMSLGALLQLGLLTTGLLYLAGALIIWRALR